MINIVTCIKVVPDPDTPAEDYRVDEKGKRIILPDAVPFVINPFDLNAVEAGLQIKEQIEGALTVISLATAPALEIIRELKHTLAMGADHAILLDDPDFEGGDSHSTAHILARAIKKQGKYDLILCGRQAADWDAAQVALGIAEILGIPVAAPIRKITPAKDSVRVERIIDQGYEELELPFPSVLALSNEANTPRIPNILGIKRAGKYEIPVWHSTDIETEADRIGISGSRTTVELLEIPQYDSICEFITGDDLEEVAGNLVIRLREEKVI